MLIIIKNTLERALDIYIIRTDKLRKRLVLRSS